MVLNTAIIITFIIRSRCYLVTRCTNLVSVHYFLPLAISAKMLINKVASGNWACVNGI